jgi:SPP1 family predicted phage head-tail adaptor
MIADMKYRVTIQHAVLTPDGAGGFSESWQNITAAPVVYAAITPATAGEQMKYGQIEATTTHHIVMRYRTDVAPGMILIDEDAVTYTIISVADQNGAKVYLEILAAVKSS